MAAACRVHGPRLEGDAPAVCLRSTGCCATPTSPRSSPTHGHVVRRRRGARPARRRCATQAIAGALAAQRRRHAAALAAALRAALRRRAAPTPARRAEPHRHGDPHQPRPRRRCRRRRCAMSSPARRAPSNLEFDLAAGGRGDRDALVEELLCEITGAEAATVVNNNAAAVLLDDRRAGAPARSDRLARRAGRDRRRLPHARRDGERGREAWSRSARPTARIRTTTSARSAPRTALVMKVHTSNYAVQGFTAAVGEASWPRIAHARGVPLATDLGSGALVDLARYGLPREPTAAGDARRRLRRRHVLGRQAARRPAGRADRRPQGDGRAHPPLPDEAGAARLASCRSPRSRRRWRSTAIPSRLAQTCRRCAC